nr:chaperone protein DnaJ 13 [Ipomoea batatas]
MAALKVAGLEPAGAAAEEYKCNGGEVLQIESRLQPAMKESAADAPPNRELYALLNISPEASTEEIRKAYRQWAQVYHPDKYQAPQMKDIATENFSTDMPKHMRFCVMETKSKIYDIYGMEGLSSGLELGMAMASEIQSQVSKSNTIAISGNLAVNGNAGGGAASVLFQHQMSSVSSIEFMASCWFLRGSTRGTNISVRWLDSSTLEYSNGNVKLFSMAVKAMHLNWKWGGGRKVSEFITVRMLYTIRNSGYLEGIFWKLELHRGGQRLIVPAMNVSCFMRCEVMTLAIMFADIYSETIFSSNGKISGELESAEKTRAQVREARAAAEKAQQLLEGMLQNRKRTRQLETGGLVVTKAVYGSRKALKDRN